MKKIYLTFLLLLSTSVSGFAQGSIMLVGGGGENYNSWSDAPYAWFVAEADSGRIVNIDTSEASDWYPDYFIDLGADPSSHALQIATTAAANDPATYDALVAASGIFIEGGDQWDYVSTWKGTLVEDAIHQVFSNGGAIGGTSAGLHIISQVVFDAHHGSAYPDYLAYDPYHSRVSFTDDFLEILPGVLADSHFQARGRLGRLVPMLARRIQDFGEADLIGIGVDEISALCIDPDGVATAYGESVTILSRSPESILQCEPDQPATFTHIRFDQLLNGAVYDLNSRTLLDPGDFLEPTSAPPGDPTYTAVTLNGSDNATAELGAVVITGMNTDPDNWYYGDLDYVPGDGIVPNSVIIPKLWSEYDFFANRIIGGQFGVATHPHFQAIYLDDDCNSTIDGDGLLTADGLTYVLDTFGAAYSGVNNYNSSGVVGALLHYLGDGDTYDLAGHNTLAIEDAQETADTGVTLLRNYPNPFNPATTIAYHVPISGAVKLAVYNTAGQQVEVLVEQVQQAGDYQIRWQPEELSSGVYVYQLETGGNRLSRLCVLVK